MKIIEYFNIYHILLKTSQFSFLKSYFEFFRKRFCLPTQMIQEKSLLMVCCEVYTITEEKTYKYLENTYINNIISSPIRRSKSTNALSNSFSKMSSHLKLSAVTAMF